MATATKSETMPTKDSVAKKDPLPVAENPPKKVVLVKQKSKEEKPAETEQKQTEMEVDKDPSEDVISPSSQTYVLAPRSSSFLLSFSNIPRTNMLCG